jgi:hypothetical protein
MATPSVAVSEIFVPFLGRARAIIKRTRQATLSSFKIGLNLSRQDTRAAFMSDRLGKRTAALRLFRRVINAMTGKIKSNNNAHGEYSCI